ncbi:hypothetical protein BU17DRAFT_60087 [Hysterangium stoloniferum]|nr:hypothetical protein BU17DRAFT_60087 [Hysterangium stoloniferum]
MFAMSCERSEIIQSNSAMGALSPQNTSIGWQSNISHTSVRILPVIKLGQEQTKSAPTLGTAASAPCLLTVEVVRDACQNCKKCAKLRRQFISGAYLTIAKELGYVPPGRLDRIVILDEEAQEQELEERSTLDEEDDGGIV